MLLLKGTQGDGRPILVVGIDAENVDRLTHDQPMVIDLKDLPAGDAKVLVVYKPTLDEVLQALCQSGIKINIDGEDYEHPDAS